MHFAERSLEAEGRHGVAFVDNDLPTVSDKIIDRSLSGEALEERDVDTAGRASLAAPNWPMALASRSRNVARRSRH
jgi:hypothetical protein